MFADHHLAARIEAAEARLSRAVADAAVSAGVSDARVAAVGSGVAVFAGPRSPVNKMIGLGFGGTLDAATLDDIEAWFSDRGEPLQAEVATLALPETVAMLWDRGYCLHGFENVLGLALSATRPPATPDSRVRIAPVSDAQAGDWIRLLVDGFAHPDEVVAAVEGPSASTLDEIFRSFYSTRDFVRYAAWWDGALAGGGSMRLDSGLAQLCGASTLPAYRRRGIQTALLESRLWDAVRAGCDLATVTTQPGSKSQQNAQRRGFALLYTRALLVKAPAGGSRPEAGGQV